MYGANGQASLDARQILVVDDNRDGAHTLQWSSVMQDIRCQSLTTATKLCRSLNLSDQKWSCSTLRCQG